LTLFLWSAPRGPVSERSVWFLAAVFCSESAFYPWDLAFKMVNIIQLLFNDIYFRIFYFILFFGSLFKGKDYYRVILGSYFIYLPILFY
jgi:hypothetical protein